MKISTKAVLLSALVFPGVGHIYLKKFGTGLALIGVAVADMYYLIAKATESALQIVGKIQDGSVPLDAAAITELASAQPVGTDALLQNIASITIIICWIIGIVDSYRIGATQDKK